MMKKRMIILFSLVTLFFSTDVCATKYNYQWDFYRGLAQVELNGKIGLINEAGEEVLPCEYDLIYPTIDERYMAVLKDELVGYVNEEGKLCVEAKYSVYNIDIIHEEMAIIVEDWDGFVRMDGTVILSPEEGYSVDDYAVGFIDGMGVARIKKDGYWGLINTEGEIVLDTIYSRIRYGESDTYLGVWDHRDLAGFVNTDGKIIVPIKWDDIGMFSGGLAAVMKDGKWGYVDEHGNLSISLAYDECRKFGMDSEVAFVKKGDYWGIIDKQGNLVRDFDLEDVGESFDNGLAPIQLNGKYGYIDTRGKIVIPPQWRYAGAFINGVAIVEETQTKWRYVDMNGEYVNELNAKDMNFFKEGLAPINVNGKYGYVDMSGQMVIEPQWNDASPFWNGFARVKKGNKYGYINKMGELIFPVIFDDGYEPDSIGGDLVTVEYEGQEGLVTNTGSVISGIKILD